MILSFSILRRRFHNETIVFQKKMKILNPERSTAFDVYSDNAIDISGFKQNYGNISACVFRSPSIFFISFVVNDPFR